MFYFDEYYIMLVLPALVLSLIAQGVVQAAFSKYSKVRNTRGITGADAAAMILRKNDIRDVRIEMASGRLSDHYDPRQKVLRLSSDVHNGSSVAAVGVAAHEVGHALQHSSSYAPLALRGALVPTANIGSNLGPIMAIVGLASGIDILVNLGIILFSAAVLFCIITLPVELNASRRAIIEIERGEILGRSELPGARKVLRAAAMTYLASVIMAIANLARLVLLSRGRRRR